jgi:transposase
MGYTLSPQEGGKAMPWKECSVMDERMRFVIRLKDGESMASLCREFGISRKTGYKIFERYEQCGLEGLTDRTRRPFRYANQLPAPVEAAIVAAKREKPHWGAKKIRERLLRKLPHAIRVPPRARFTRCSIGTGWSVGPLVPEHRRRARHYPTV